MNVITHALLPVIAAGLHEGSYKIEEERKGLFSVKMLVVVGLFGAAPDLVNPHISLDARHSSFSHGIPFWAILTICLAVFGFVRRKVFSSRIIVWFSGAYFFHLCCDAISGGLAWKYPLDSDIIGTFYINPIWWIPLDVFCFLSAYCIFRAIPRIRQARNSNQRRVDLNDSLKEPRKVLTRKP